MRIRAVLLTAGFGMRLRPLTLFIPKPLLPVCGEAVASYSLRSFLAVGCEAVVLNVHYLGDMIKDKFGHDYQGLTIEYSFERELKGTLGALAPLCDFLSDADVILLANGDTLCEWPWEAMIEAHCRSEADATLLLHERVPEETLGGPVGIDATGAVVQLRDSPRMGVVERRHLFAGAHVLSPGLLDGVKDRVADIVADLYIPVLQDGGRVHSVMTSAAWHDLGTPDRFLRANIESCKVHSGFTEWACPVSQDSYIDPAAIVAGTSIQEGVAIQLRSTVEDSVVFRDAVVEADCRIRSSILGPGVRIPAGNCIEDRLVTCRRRDYEVASGESVVGDLLYSPL